MNDSSQDRPTYLELLHSLEKARGRLAVAIATESKATPLDRLRYYRETEERVHRWLKELRSRRDTALEENEEWLKVLEALKRIPSAPDHILARHGATLQLCQHLREALAPLEQLEHKKSKGEGSRALLHRKGTEGEG